MPWLLLTMFGQCTFCSEIGGLRATGYIEWVLHSIIFISSLRLLSVFTQCRLVLKYRCIVCLARTLHNERICVKIFPNWFYCYLTVESLLFSGYVYNLTNNMLWIIFVCSGSPKRRPNRMPWLLLTMFVQYIALIGYASSIIPIYWVRQFSGARGFSRAAYGVGCAQSTSDPRKLRDTVYYESCIHTTLTKTHQTTGQGKA